MCFLQNLSFLLFCIMSFQIKDRCHGTLLILGENTE